MEIKLLYTDKETEAFSFGINGFRTTGIQLRSDPTKSDYEIGVVQLTGLTKAKKPSAQTLGVPLADIPHLIQALQAIYDETH